MKKNKIFLMPLFFVIFFMSQAGFLRSQEFFFDPTVKITMDFKDANIKDVLKVFSVQSGSNFIASSALQDRMLTLYFNNVAIEDAINQIFRANNLSYEFVPESNIYIVKDMGLQAVETITRVYKLKYARVENSWIDQEIDYKLNPENQQTDGTSSSSSSTGSSSQREKEEYGLTKVIKRILSEHGKIVEDKRTNSLIITDVPANFSRIESVITQLDVASPQVLIEVEMIDISKATSDAIGVNWSGTWMHLSGGASRNTAFPWSWNNQFRAAMEAGTAPPLAVVPTYTLGTLTATALTAMLNFIETKTDTKYLARPRIMCMNNEMAEIKITTNESIGVTTGALAQQASNVGAVTQISAPERAETGVSLRVAPQINLETGEITMYVEPMVKDVRAGTQIAAPAGNFTYRDPEQRSTKSTLRIKDGETIVIGGLLRDRQAERVQGIPWLSKIPILGKYLFSQKYSGNTGFGGQTGPGVTDQRELLVFITPHIIRDEATMRIASNNAVEPLQPQVPISIPVREQAPTAIRQKAINETLKNFE